MQLIHQINRGTVSNQCYSQNFTLEWTLAGISIKPVPSTHQEIISLPRLINVTFEFLPRLHCDDDRFHF